MWKFRHRSRAGLEGSEGPEKRHRAGREMLITVEGVGVLCTAFNGSMLLVLVVERE